MSLLGSLFCGYEGVYNVLGVTLKFQNEPNEAIHLENKEDANKVSENKTVVNLEGAGIISRLAMKCLNSRVFHCVTHSRVHLFVHEMMGHALAGKILFSSTKTSPRTVIVFDPKTAATYHIPQYQGTPNWNELYELDDSARE